MALVIDTQGGQIVKVTATCKRHVDCYEKEVLVLHRPFAEGMPKEEEKPCSICTLDGKAFQKAMQEGKAWKCPVCGVEHNPVKNPEGRTIASSPVLSRWEPEAFKGR